MWPLESKLAAQLHAHDWQSVTSLVAVSGGADSVALARAISRLPRGGKGQIIVVHFHHGLRGADADRDAEFVAELAGSLGWESEIGRADGTQLHAVGDSLERAARAARYDFFRQVADERGARYLFTAHTADDQAETILHRIVRGTGIDGLSGIPRVRPLSPLTTVVRPLLDVRRAEIVEYLRQADQPWRDDATNTELHFTRNRLRHDLLPKLAAEYNPSVVDALLRLGEMAGEAQGVVNARLGDFADLVLPSPPHQLRLQLTRLHEQPPYLLRQLLMKLWREREWPLQAMTYDKWQQLAQLALAERDGVLQLPGAIIAQKQGEELLLTRPVVDTQ